MRKPVPKPSPFSETIRPTARMRSAPSGRKKLLMSWLCPMIRSRGLKPASGAPLATFEASFDAT